MKQLPYPAVTLLDHSGDLMFQAVGRDFLEALAHASCGMVDQIVPLSRIEEKEEYNLLIEEEDEPALVAAFLNELLFLIYGRKWLPRRVRILKQCANIPCGRLEGILTGEPFDPARHQVKHEIKAVTYHELAVIRDDGTTTIRFVCDL